MITFINDFCRYVWVGFIGKKSKALDKIKDFRNKVKSEVGRKVKCLHTDNERYVSLMNSPYICKHTRYNTKLTSHTLPQKNVVAERKSQHAKNIPPCLMCMKTIVYITNNLLEARPRFFFSPYQILWNVLS